MISWMYSSRLVRAHTDQFLLRFKKPNLIRPEHKKWGSVRAPKNLEDRRLVGAIVVAVGRLDNQPTLDRQRFQLD